MNFVPAKFLMYFDSFWKARPPVLSVVEVSSKMGYTALMLTEKRTLARLFCLSRNQNILRKNFFVKQGIKKQNKIYLKTISQWDLRLYFAVKDIRFVRRKKYNKTK